MRVLLIEDSARSQRSLAFALRKTGYTVELAGNGREGLDLLKTRPFDAVILDLMLPELDGLSCLCRAREAGVSAPVIVVTVKNSLEDRLTCLESGADDYLSKPFSLEELLARLEALLRRKLSLDHSALTVGPLKIDTDACLVMYNGQLVDLTPREFKVLKVLAENAGHTVSRADIEAHLYSEERDVFSNVVESTVSTLRRKLTVPGESQLIHTERGAGYVLKPE